MIRTVKSMVRRNGVKKSASNIEIPTNAVFGNDTNGTKTLSRHSARRCNAIKLFGSIAIVVAIFAVFQLTNKLSFMDGKAATFHSHNPVESTNVGNHHPLGLQSRNGTLVTLVHIGKTGGSALRKLIDASIDYCEVNHLYHPDSLLPECYQQEETKTALQQHLCALARVTNKSTGLVHLNRNLDRTLSDQRFLVPIRNPIDRMVSWFYYEKHFQTIKKTRYSKALEELIDPSRCGFATANDLFLGRKTQHDKNTTTTSMASGSIFRRESTTVSPEHANKKPEYPSEATPEYCYNLSRDCLSGNIPCYGHNFFNYEYYLEEILRRILESRAKQYSATTTTITNTTNPPRVDVIRAENSWDDMNRTLVDWTGIPMTADMEIFYSIRKPFDVDTSQDDATNNELSADAARNLCETICPELVVYTKIIKYAANMSPEEKFKSKNQLEGACGFSVDKVCGKSFRYRKIRHTKESKLCEPAVRRTVDSKNGGKDGDGEHHRRLAFLRAPGRAGSNGGSDFFPPC